jgi:hypothetical protein
VDGSFGTKEQSSCDVWNQFGDFWWIFGVFRATDDLFIIIFQKLRVLLQFLHHVGTAVQFTRGSEA